MRLSAGTIIFRNDDITNSMNMNSEKIYIIRCNDVDSSIVKGVYHTLGTAEENLLKMVNAINKRISKRNDDFENTFDKAVVGEGNEDILVRYRNGVRVMEIKECLPD